jgi:uncharacterized protein YlzI (FlbEa/FlbD family)
MTFLKLTILQSKNAAGPRVLVNGQRIISVIPQDTGTLIVMFSNGDGYVVKESVEEIAVMLAGEHPKETAILCPNCGSPKYTDLSGMGPEKEYECQDCFNHYAPVNDAQRDDRSQ